MYSNILTDVLFMWINIYLSDRKKNIQTIPPEQYTNR